MIPHETWFAVGAVLFGIVTLRGLWLAKQRSAGRRAQLALVAMTGVATATYAAMLLGIGQTTNNGVPIFAPRYVNWLVSTPLMMLFLGWLGNTGWRTTAALAGLCFAATLTGVLGAWYTTPLISVGGPLLVVAFLYVLMRVLPRHASFRTEQAEALFSKLRTLSIVLWPVYVVVLLIAPTGEVKLLVTDTSVLVVAYLDLLFVGGFVTMIQNTPGAFDDSLLTDVTAGEGAGPTASDDSVSSAD